MANMFWNLDKISETTAIHSGFRLCPIISHSSMRLTMPVAFIYKIPPALLFLTVLSIHRILFPMRQEGMVSFGSKTFKMRKGKL